MPELHIRYDRLIQDALRDVVKSVLADCARDGLQGEHHFYIGVRSNYPGVVMPDYLRAKYPDEIVIVLQRKFWDLKVDEERFSVGLSFGGAPTNFAAPFAAVTSFRDPYARIGFQFEVDGAPPRMAPKIVEGPTATAAPAADDAAREVSAAQEADAAAAGAEETSGDAPASPAEPAAATRAYETDGDGVVRVDFGKKR